MISFDDFIAEHNGKFDPISLDQKRNGEVLYQCVYLANSYIVECLPGNPEIHDNANNFFHDASPTNYDKIVNTASNAPVKGDIIVWTPSTNPTVDPYGHVAICVAADANGFTSFDQNWPLNSKCHLQDHTYTTPAGIDVLGWLHPVTQDSNPVPMPPAPGSNAQGGDTTMTDDEKNALGVLEPLVTTGQFGNLEGAARAGVGALQDATTLSGHVDSLQKMLDTDVARINTLQTQNEALRQQVADATSQNPPPPALTTYSAGQLINALFLVVFKGKRP